MANVALDIFCALISLLLLGYVLLQTSRRERMNRFFILICLCNLGMLLGDLPNWLWEGFARPWHPAALWTGCLAQFLCGAWLPLAYAGYLSAFLAPKVRIDRRFTAVIGLAGGAATLLVLLNLLSGMVYYIDAANIYHRGSWWWLSQALSAAMILTCMVIVLRYRRHMTGRVLATFLAYQFLPLPAILLQGFFYGVACTYPATTLAIVIIFLNIQSEQALLMERQRREMTEAQTAVMLSQIQPHFLYNALSAIDRLCFENAAQAHQAILLFSQFLRGNMDSLSEKELIPLERELEHVRLYLTLEQLRFEERLQVVYDIQCDQFKVPVLTVQPLVENAVRYGVTNRPGGGTLTLRAVERPDCWRVEVADDGAGFDPQAPLPDGRSHTGIQNVRARLETMCGGRLEIQSAPGQGTTATIVIPKQAKTRNRIPPAFGVPEVYEKVLK